MQVAFINFIVYFCGTLILIGFYFNYYVLEQYFLALFWAVVVSIPLFQIKQRILEFIVDL